MKYPVAYLSAYGAELLARAGLPEGEARQLIDCMLVADMRGIASHGISRLRTYSARVKAGVIAVGVVPEILSESGAVMAVDGKNGVGASVGRWVMDRCVEKANETGACFATVNHGCHFGIGAYYTEYAAQKGMIGLALCNSEASVAPTGGAGPMLGTNPLSVAVPAERHPPFVLDMATSVVARGKIILAKKEGKSIPDSWAVDKDGVPTTDPEAALGGFLLPFGGAKGYGISLLIDILCSCLGGALDSRRTFPFWDDFENPQNAGYFMGALDIGRFVDLGTFKQRVDLMFDEFKSCPAAPGFSEVMIPGEIEHNLRTRSEKEGIELSDAVAQDLKALAGEYGVSNLFS